MLRCGNDSGWGCRPGKDSMDPEQHLTRVRLALGLGVLGAIASILSVFAAPVEGASGFGCFVKWFNCDNALDSKYSKLFGISLGVFGLFYFAFWGLMLDAWRRTAWDGYRFAVTTTLFPGALISLFLLFLLTFVIEGFCLYCLITHLANLGAFAVLWRLRDWRFPLPIPREQFRRCVSLTVIALVLASALHVAGEIRAEKARARAAEETIW